MAEGEEKRAASDAAALTFRLRRKVAFGVEALGVDFGAEGTIEKCEGTGTMGLDGPALIDSGAATPEGVDST